MTSMNEQRPPAVIPEGINVQAADLSNSLSECAAERLRDDLDGVLVLIVYRADGGVRRRVVLTVAAAQRAADRAEAAGHRARIVLARLKPVSEVSR